MTDTAAPAGAPLRFAQLTAPVARRLAGRRYFPLWAVVHHRGRRSGRELTVPVALCVHRETFLIVLPWGTNWARNVLAAGGCVLRWKGADHTVTGAEVIGRDRARAHFGRVTWLVVERLMGAQEFLLLRRVQRGPR